MKIKNSSMIVFYKYLLDSVSVTLASIYRVERKRSCESLTFKSRGRPQIAEFPAPRETRS